MKAISLDEWRANARALKSPHAVAALAAIREALLRELRPLTAAEAAAVLAEVSLDVQVRCDAAEETGFNVEPVDDGLRFV